MSAPIGSAFSIIPYFRVLSRSDYMPNGTRVFMPREDKPMKAYRIHNIQTNQYWSNGMWRKSGKVYSRMCDVKAVLNKMTHNNFCKAEIIDYLLVSHPDSMISLDQFNSVLARFKDELHEVSKGNT